MKKQPYTHNINQKQTQLKSVVYYYTPAITADTWIEVPYSSIANDINKDNIISVLWQGGSSAIKHITMQTHSAGFYFNTDASATSPNIAFKFVYAP